MSDANTHPFTHGAWSFAHNGPIDDLEHVRTRLDLGGPPPSLNFLLTDGHQLAASRWGNTLYWTFRNGVPDCSVCGTSHCPSADERYCAVVLASEPLTEEGWMEVPDGSILVVEPGAHTLRRDLVPDAVGAFRRDGPNTCRTEPGPLPWRLAPIRVSSNGSSNGWAVTRGYLQASADTPIP